MISKRQARAEHLAEVLRGEVDTLRAQLTAAQAEIARLSEEFRQKQLYVRKALLRGSEDPCHPPTAELASQVAERAEQAEAARARLREGLLTLRLHVMDRVAITRMIDEALATPVRPTEDQ